MHIDDFIAKVISASVDFQFNYVTKHKQDPESWPLQLTAEEWTAEYEEHLGEVFYNLEAEDET